MSIKSILILGISFFLFSCNNGKETNVSNININKTDVMLSVNLTVSESKRLIALGIANSPMVKEKMESGMIIITKGSTNTYIAEQLCDTSISMAKFITGHFVPNNKKQINEGVKSLSEIVLVNGKQVNMSYQEALSQMKEGDIIFKGGNLLDYDNRQAAVCIGAPDGGTTFKMLPYIKKNKANFIIPIGLEKQIFGNLSDYEKAMSYSNKRLNYMPKLYVFKEGKIYTEIEAIKTFAKVDVFPIGVGGIEGREGGITLIVAGKPEEVKKVEDIVSKVHEEENIILSDSI